MLNHNMTAFAAAKGNIQATIDASRSGAPVNPMVFGGYMEPATTNVWAEMLTDRKFANPITDAAPPAPANSFFRRFFGDPFKPVGPPGTVVMDTVRPFVGKHSPLIKLQRHRAPRHSTVQIAPGPRQDLRRPCLSCWRCRR